MFARSHLDLHNIRLSIERTKKLSDNVVGVGPVGIGLDGILSIVPPVGMLYSGGAGLMLLWDGLRARASSSTLVQMGVILFLDTFASMLPPGVNALVDTLFTGHKWSANLLIKHMDETIYFEGRRRDVKDTREYAELLSRIRAGKEKRRVIFLGDLLKA